MSLVSRLRGLSPGDYARLLAASGLLVYARVGLAVWSLTGVRGMLLWLTSFVSGTVPGSPAPARVTGAVAAADKYLPGSRTCLMRSVTSETLLRLYGYAPTHRIGVDKGDDDFEAHSWIEYDGEVLIGGQGDLSRFETLTALNERDGS